MKTTTVIDVTVSGLVYSVDGRTLELRATGGGYQVTDVTNSVARALGGVRTLSGAVEDAYAALCPQDPAVPGSRANDALRKSKRAGDIATANRRWAAAMATTEPVQS